MLDEQRKWRYEQSLASSSILIEEGEGSDGETNIQNANKIVASRGLVMDEKKKKKWKVVVSWTIW